MAGCLLGGPARRRPVLFVLVPPRRLSVRRRIQPRPSYVRIKDLTNYVPCLQGQIGDGTLVRSLKRRSAVVLVTNRVTINRALSFSIGLCRTLFIRSFENMLRTVVYDTTKT